MLQRLLSFIAIVIFLNACHKNTVVDNPVTGCDIQKTFIANAAKVNITNGIWGTISFMEGNCMPMVGGVSTCKKCPVKRTIRIYDYTLRSQATPQVGVGGFYDSFSSPLIKEISSDGNGFFQTDLPAGHYTLVVVENGKLYAGGLDGVGGINPFVLTTGLQNLNFAITYKAVF